MKRWWYDQEGRCLGCSQPKPPESYSGADTEVPEAAVWYFDHPGFPGTCNLTGEWFGKAMLYPPVMGRDFSRPPSHEDEG